MIDGVSSLMAKAGGGMQTAEGRLQQIEGMITSIEGRMNQLAPTGPSLPADPLAGGPGAIAPAEVGKKPFQFYLKSAEALGEVAKATPVAQIPQLRGLNNAQAFQPLINKLSIQYGVDRNLVNAVVQQESGFNPNAVSKSGAVGLMQLMPATAKGLGVTNSFDPGQNLEGGIKHLKGLLAQFNGNIPLALAAYNAGAGAVTKHKGIPPYAETQNYVRSILANYLKTRPAEA